MVFVTTIPATIVEMPREVNVLVLCEPAMFELMVLRFVCTPNCAVDSWALVVDADAAPVSIPVLSDACVDCRLTNVAPSVERPVDKAVE